MARKWKFVKSRPCLWAMRRPCSVRSMSDMSPPKSNWTLDRYVRVMLTPHSFLDYNMTQGEGSGRVGSGNSQRFLGAGTWAFRFTDSFAADDIQHDVLSLVQAAFSTVLLTDWTWLMTGSGGWRDDKVDGGCV